MNRLYFGDNLRWLRNTKEFSDESVDLVYLDPPFNSNADYNVLFRETSGEAKEAGLTVVMSRHCSAMWKIRKRRGEF